MIKVLDIREIDNEKNKSLKAFVDVEYQKVTIKDFRIIQHDGGRAWVACPQTSFVGQDGKRKFRTIVTMPNALKGELDVAILSAWQKVKENTDEEGQS